MHDIPTEHDAEEAPSDEFRNELAAFEHATSAPAQHRDVKAGDAVRATIVMFGDEQTLVDFGGRSEGIVESKLLKDDAGTPRYQVGDTLELFVVEAADQILLAPSLKADPRQALRQVREAREAGMPLSGRVTAQNSGGLAVDIAGVRGFCPVSQIEAGFCADPSAYIGRTLEFLVTEIDEARHQAVLSRKALLRRETEAQAQKLVATLKPGDELEGTVARLEPFGAFIDLGGVDGMVHVSEVAHERIAHPRDALSPGQKVRVRVLRLDTGKDGKQRIALSIKAATPDPWTTVAERFTAGMRVRGTVARLTDFGAFVTLAPGIDGLLHVSEAALHRITHVKEVLAPGQEIEAFVRVVDAAKRRIALSIRELLAQDMPRREPRVGDTFEGTIAGIQPYGLFVDLPEYGPRTRGLVPREETGEPRGTDLAKRFTVGESVAVEVKSIEGDRIRLGLGRAARTPAAAESRPAGDAAPTEPAKPQELTTMAIALREAMERAKAKQRDG